MSGFALRPATPSDALALSVLASQVFVETYGPEGISPRFAREVTQTFDVRALASLLAGGDTRVVVAEEADRLQGFVQWRAGQQALLPDLPSAEVQRLYVLRALAGRGIGSRLLARAEGDAASLGAKQSWLTAWVGNKSALAFYARRGYGAAGTAPYVFEDESWDNQVLVKPLA